MSTSAAFVHSTNQSAALSATFSASVIMIEEDIDIEIDITGK